jgi:hypothetical protein
MNQTATSRILPSAGVLLVLGLLDLASVMAAERSSSAQAQRLYERESARCMKLRPEGGRADCLSAASTRRAAALPTAADEDPARLARNALQRCVPLPEPDRADCVARVQGQGTTSGSVAAGGIYRELVTREALPASAAASAPK